MPATAAPTSGWDNFRLLDDLHEVFTEKLRTLASQLAHALTQELRETHIAIARSEMAREKLGALPSLLRLGSAYGRIKEKDEQEILEKVRAQKPNLFESPCDGFWSHIAAWWRSM